MGCFLGCFGSSKHRKHKHKHNVQVQRNGNSNNKQEQPSVSLVQDCSKNAINPSPQLHDKSDEQLSVSSRRKVTFDSNVKTYDPVFADEVEERKSEEGGKEKALAQSKSSSSEDSSLASSGSFLPNHRYQNCRESDDEQEEIDYGDSDLSDEDEDDDVIREERNGEDGVVVTTAADHVFAEEDVDVNSIGSNPNVRDRSVYVHPVLNPVENLTQWKVVKAKRTPPSRPQKENDLQFGVKEPSFSLNSETDPPKKLNQDIPVDASLSNWLLSSETTPQTNKVGSATCFDAGTPDRSTTSHGSYSVISHEDRPILGALTLEEIKQFSATSSPRKSPTRSPDEMPIIGTVGTHWNVSAENSGSASSFKGIPNTTSKYREDKTVKWHSTPFETRLEKALNRDAASAYVPRVF